GPAGVGDRPPKNRMEAHFQMTLLVGEIVSAQGAPGRAEAEGLRGQAQSAYARADYTEALRLALRGRRALGSRLETLPAVGSAGGSRAPGALAPTPDRAAAASRSCAQCGRPLQAEDRFCRGCGATNVPTQCPRCQGELGPSDTFCGRCGAPVS
ncbi:MAG TPA: zinc ribbon domain-containing protein, partial [Thermoplasmata archaeon]|nr:zinc ribbon domain-containing protein [Thermoplasmata archaeon]